MGKGSKSRQSGLLSSLLICLMISGCSGCIQGTCADFMRYDPHEDSYAFLQSWTNIKCADDRQVEHVLSLWDRRERIVTVPLPILSAPAVERLGNHQLRCINLGHPNNEEESKQEVLDVELDSIQIIPGEFYLNAEQGLCYYHQVVIAGKTLDQILAAVTPVLAGQVEEIATEAIEMIRVGKLEQISWDEFRTTTQKNLDPESVPDTASDSGIDTIPLEVESLILLRNANALGQIKLSRAGDVFAVVFPLTQRDCKEVVATCELLHDQVVQLTKEGQPVVGGYRILAETVSVRSIDGTTVKVSVNLKKLLEGASESSDSEAKAPVSDTLKAARAWTVKSMESRQVPINPDAAVEKVFAKYLVD